jgi:ABC-2 type transport system permease protein
VSVDQNALFARLRWRLLANTWKVFQGESVIRPATILFSIALVFTFVFAVSWAGFRFITEVVKVPATGQILTVLIGLLFFTLGGALVFSTGLILHGSLFSSPEAGFLLSRPVHAGQIFAYKFQTAMAYSSWAFILLAFPVLLTYGMACHAPWWYYAMMPAFFVGYVPIPGAAGAILALLVVNFFPNRRKTVLVIAVAALALGLGWWAWGVITESREATWSGDPGADAAGAILGRVSFTAAIGMPSAWVARGLNYAARGSLPEAAWYLWALCVNGAFSYLAATWAATLLYRRGYNRVATGGDLRSRHGNALADRILLWCLPWWVKNSTKLLVLKDFRTFRRDPQQWGQVVLFLALLALYFGSMRSRFIHGIEWPWQNGLSLMNLALVALLLCTYTGRFVFPMLSLEGRKFWILGLLPISRDDLLWGKFGFAAVVGVLLSLPMMLLSDVMLGMPWHTHLVHGLTVCVLAIGLSGLSVGLGACMPVFNEPDPSKVAVGFGGTVNLVVGLVFLIAVTGAMAGPYHLALAWQQRADDPSSPWLWGIAGAGLSLGVALGAAATYLPMRAGILSLRAAEL